LKNKLFLSIISGLLLSISWPTNGSPIFLFIALVPILYLVKLINYSSKKNKLLSAFCYSYLTFFIWNLITTWWIYNSSAFGAIFAIICNSSFYAILISFYLWSIKRLPKSGSTLFLIALWISFEKFHLNWEFTWPWLNLGNAFSENIYWIQWYEYTGVFGGTLWVLILNFGFLNIFEFYIKSPNKSEVIKKIIPLLLCISFPIVISLLIYKNRNPLTKKISITLFQPNIDPYNEKYFSTNIENLNILKELTKGSLNDKTDYLITPETYFSEGSGEEISKLNDSELFDSINNFIKNYPNLNLISGIQLYKLHYNEKTLGSSSNFIRDNLWVDFFNSAIQINDKFDYQIYHKSKFVPGVEIMPYKKILKPFIGDFMINLGGTVTSRTVQKNRSVFYNSDKKIYTAPIICYESIYGSYITEFVRNGANFLTIISNDGWWGNTQGHKQLLSYSRLRAIENRRAIARSANTGVSAFINIYGEVEASVKYGEIGVLTGTLNLNDEITFYTKYEDYIARISILLTLILFSLSLSGRYKK